MFTLTLTLITFSPKGGKFAELISIVALAVGVGLDPSLDPLATGRASLLPFWVLCRAPGTPGTDLLFLSLFVLGWLGLGLEVRVRVRDGGREYIRHQIGFRMGQGVYKKSVRDGVRDGDMEYIRHRSVNFCVYLHNDSETLVQEIHHRERTYSKRERERVCMRDSEDRESGIRERVREERVRDNEKERDKEWVREMKK
jgi:hypothetical protein